MFRHFSTKIRELFNKEDYINGLLYHPEDSRHRPKFVGGLPHVCVSLCHIILQLLAHAGRLILLYGTW